MGARSRGTPIAQSTGIGGDLKCRAPRSVANADLAHQVELGALVLLFAARLQRSAFGLALNAARQMTVDHRVGSITVGKDADVVVWNGNPLSNRSRVERTYVEGRLMFTRALDQQLRSRDAALRAFLEQEALKELAGGAPSATPRRAPSHEYHCDDIHDEMAGTGERD